MDMNIRRLEAHAVASPPRTPWHFLGAPHCRNHSQSSRDATPRTPREANDELSLEVKDWGGTDAPRPSEIVDLVIAFGPATIGAAVRWPRMNALSASSLSLRGTT